MEDRKYPEDVMKRLEGYAEKFGIQIGEAANKFHDWLKEEFLVEDPFAEDHFYLSHKLKSFF